MWLASISMMKSGASTKGLLLPFFCLCLYKMKRNEENWPQYNPCKPSRQHQIQCQPNGMSASILCCRGNCFHSYSAGPRLCLFPLMPPLSPAARRDRVTPLTLRGCCWDLKCTAGQSVHIHLLSKGNMTDFSPGWPRGFRARQKTSATV